MFAIDSNCHMPIVAIVERLMRSIVGIMIFRTNSVHLIPMLSLL